MNFRIELESRLDSVSLAMNDERNFPIEKFAEFAALTSKHLLAGNRVAFVGNGGSAAEAMHIAAEFTGKCVIDHRPLPVLCLNESISSLTAISNDYGFEYVFSRQIEAHLSRGDLLVLLSTSGKSKNIHEAITKAKTIGVKCYLWSGENCPDFDGVEVWRVYSKSTPRIQEIHLVWGHLLSELVELSLS